MGLQDELFDQALKAARPVSLYLKSGVPMRGMVLAHDNFTVLLENENHSVLIYKHSITSLVSARRGGDKTRKAPFPKKPGNGNSGPIPKK